jgi:polar amino acid transport system substrate-binding protein
MVGFNRRFAPFTTKAREFFAKRKEPMMVHARVNAGYIPAQHWTQQMIEGGRIIGELCHFVDWARCLVGCPIRTVWAAALPDGSRYNRDNVSVHLTFTDGSMANLLYLANGDPSVPKEYFEVSCEGAIARLEDFVSLELTRNRKSQRLKASRDKGHGRELRLTIEAMCAGKEAPIPFVEIAEVTEATFAICEALSTGQVLSLEETANTLTPA